MTTSDKAAFVFYVILMALSWVLMGYFFINKL